MTLEPVRLEADNTQANTGRFGAAIKSYDIHSDQKKKRKRVQGKKWRKLLTSSFLSYFFMMYTAQL